MRELVLAEGTEREAAGAGVTLRVEHRAVVVEAAGPEKIVSPEEPRSVNMASCQDNVAPLPELHIRFTNGNELSIKHATVAHLKTLVESLQ